MHRFFLMFLIALLFAACEESAVKKTTDDEAVTDTDPTGSCGDGAVSGEEVCEPGDTIDCTAVTVGYGGTATCYDDCSGWDLTECLDIDECTDTPDICGDAEHATCKNTDGAFKCTCKNGYVPTSDDMLCVPRYDFEGPTYQGDLLLIVNEDVDGNNQAFIGTMPQRAAATLLSAEMPAPATAAEIPFPTHGRVLPLPPHATPDRRLGIYRKIEPVPDPEIGDVREFWTSDLNTGKRSKINAKALHVGEHCIIWAQMPTNIGTATAQTIGNEFDKTIYGLITTTFYEASDVDGNGKITIMLIDAGGQAGGYFSPYELYDFPDSNKADMIFIEEMIAQYGGGSYANGVIAHEFTHLVHNNRDDLVEGNPNGELWIWEGMSTAGEHVYRGFQRDYKSTYNSNESIANGMSVTYWEYTSQDVIGNYALTYLFHQYLRIHAGQGSDFYRELIESPNNDYRDHDALIKKYIDPDLNTLKMLTNFRIALITNEATGLYGFKKESGFTGFEKRYWPGVGDNDFYLRGGGALQLRLTTGSFRDPGDSDGGIRYIGIFGGTKAPVTREEYLGE